jgi:hypothetical protein
LAADENPAASPGAIIPTGEPETVQALVQRELENVSALFIAEAKLKAREESRRQRYEYLMSERRLLKSRLAEVEKEIATLRPLRSEKE